MKIENASKIPSLLTADTAEALQYLVATDWYVIRLVETGKPIPEDVAVKRTESRLRIGEQ